MNVHPVAFPTLLAGERRDKLVVIWPNDFDKILRPIAGDPLAPRTCYDRQLSGMLNMPQGAVSELVR